MTNEGHPIYYSETPEDEASTKKPIQGGEAL
jgi:hypothetical protein